MFFLKNKQNNIFFYTNKIIFSSLNPLNFPYLTPTITRKRNKKKSCLHVYTCFFNIITLTAIQSQNTAVSSSLNPLNSVSDITFDSNCTSNTQFDSVTICTAAAKTTTAQQHPYIDAAFNLDFHSSMTTPWGIIAISVHKNFLPCLIAYGSYLVCVWIPWFSRHLVFTCCFCCKICNFNQYECQLNFELFSCV